MYRAFVKVHNKIHESVLHNHVAFQVKSELTHVEQSDAQSTAMEDSFARVGYSVEAEQAVNEQIK